ncbi:Diaminopimelate decarboxylase, partial [Salmonella enterica subsp. enterica serovar Johannesburg str. S5-703]
MVIGAEELRQRCASGNAHLVLLQEANAHLVLLQEAQTTPELVQFATANYLAADQVPAFVLPQHPSGVMTLSAAHPV